MASTKTLKIPILMYHQIDAAPPKGAPMRGLVVTPGAFARQMGLLKLLGYQGLSMRDLEPYLSGAKHGKVFGITFDDGYQNNLLHALPVLLRHGFTATCYGVSQQIGGTNAWDAHKGIAQKPLMTRSEWHQWQGAGMDIGSHTRTHVDLTTIAPEAAWEEIATAKHELERCTGVIVRHFCYPYGHFNETIQSMMQRAGYATATTTVRGRATLQDDPYALPRVLVSGSSTLVHLALKVLTRYEDRRRSQ